MTGDARFTRRTEDFCCANCAEMVEGDGYTNHCPACLWSLHVDINPGDRASECRGTMRPVGIDQKSGEWRVMHECTVCGHRKVNRLAAGDNREVVLALASEPLLD
jgi:ribosomal protein L37AE/L43A